MARPLGLSIPAFTDPPLILADGVESSGVGSTAVQCDIPEQASKFKGTPACDTYATKLYNVICKNDYDVCQYDGLSGETEIGKGSFGTVYTIPGNETTVYKVSNILVNALEASSKSRDNCLGSSELVSNYENIDEIFDIVNKLCNMMPNNINKIISHKKCKTTKIKFDRWSSATEYKFPGYVLEYAMDKHNGIMMENAIGLMAENDILKTFLQLIYVVNVCNTNFFYHNDLKFTNMMVSANIIKTEGAPDRLTDPKDDLNLNALMVMYNGISLQILLELKNTYVIQLIDFEISIVDNTPGFKFPYEIFRIHQLYENIGSSELKAFNQEIATYMIKNFAQYILKDLVSNKKNYVTNFVSAPDKLIILNVILFKSIMELCATNTDVNVKILVNGIDKSADTTDHILECFGLTTIEKLWYTKSVLSAGGSRVISLKNAKYLSI
jgi:serine/threonine protein kinase